MKKILFLFLIVFLLGCSKINLDCSKLLVKEDVEKACSNKIVFQNLKDQGGLDIQLKQSVKDFCLYTAVDSGGSSMSVLIAEFPSAKAALDNYYKMRSSKLIDDIIDENDVGDRSMFLAAGDFITYAFVSEKNFGKITLQGHGSMVCGQEGMKNIAEKLITRI